MAFSNLFKRVSQAPINPEPVERAARNFDVADLYRGPVATGEDSIGAAEAIPLDEKLRQAYFWIVNSAIISPHYDIEYNEAPPTRFTVGDGKTRLTLPSAQSYSSFVLLPLRISSSSSACRRPRRAGSRTARWKSSHTRSAATSSPRPPSPTTRAASPACAAPCPASMRRRQ